MISFIKFEDNGMEGLVWDFKIGKKDRNSYIFCLFKNNGKINKKSDLLRNKKTLFK